MGGVCPSRKPAAAAAMPQGTKSVISSKDAVHRYTCLMPSKDAAISQEVLRAKGETTDKLTLSSPNALPVKSWRALLEEADLKTDAKPFQVPDAKSAARAPITKRNVGGPPTSNELVPMGSGMTVQTETYLKLLKEGGSKRKTALPSPMLRNKATVLGSAKQGPSTQSESAPMTATSLRQAWTNALTAPGNKQGEDAPKKNKLSQDDILLEKLTADHDLSDLAYWSETDSVDKAVVNASAHRLGYCQRTTVHSYVMQDLNFNVDRAVGMMLSRLQRFCEQHQMMIQEKDSYSAHMNGQRRFVFGLKEVMRRIKQNSVSCLIVAPDLESNTKDGGLDDRMREIIASAHEKNIPVIFALSRARLGQALGRTMLISVLGVLDVTGVQDLFNTAVELAREGCQTWLGRLPDK